MEKQVGTGRGMTLPIADSMSNLMYSYKYGLKDQYFRALNSLKEVMDEGLYQFYFNFGCTATWKKV